MASKKLQSNASTTNCLRFCSPLPAVCKALAAYVVTKDAVDWSQECRLHPELLHAASRVSVPH